MFQSALIEQAVFDMVEWHSNTHRKNSEPVALHCMRVAAKASKYVTHGQREFMTVCGLLHESVGSGHKEASDLTTRYGQRIVDVVKEVNRHPDIWKLIKHEDTHDFFVKLTEEKERMAKASYYAKLLKVCDIQDGVETMREDFTRFRWQKEWAIQWLMRKWHVLSVMTDVDQSVFAPTQELVEQKLIELHPEFRADRRFRGPAK